MNKLAISLIMFYKKYISHYLGKVSANLRQLVLAMPL